MIAYRSMVLCAAVVAMFCVSSAWAQSEGTLTVVGTGSAHESADRVTLALTVSSQDNTATGLFVKSADVVMRLKKALVAAGLKEMDIHELAYKLMPNMEYGQNGTRITSYRMDNQLEVMVEDVALLPHLIDLSTQYGAGSVMLGEFTSAKAGDLHLEAMQSAIADARKQAQELAKAAGKSVGEIVSISDVAAEPMMAKPQAKGGEAEEEEEEEREHAQSKQAKPAESTHTFSESASYKVVFRLR